MRVKKIRVERYNDFRLVKIADRLSRGNTVAIERVPETPPRGREFLQYIGQLSNQRGRADRLGKNAESRSAIGFHRLQCEIQRIPKIVGGPDCAACGDRLCAVRSVEVKNVALG